MPPTNQSGQPGKKPKLVNRGPAGLLTKVDGKPAAATPPAKAPPVEGKKNNIAEDLRKGGLVKPIESLTTDPENARLHPDRNMESIRASLRLYGQTKPIVVRRANNVVIAGNGTLQAAKDLGWTEIAVSFVDMNEVEAAGYGLADNRTAELAKWDFEIVARLDRLLQEAGHETVGWSDDELSVLRAADWVPPPVDEAQFGVGGSSESDPLLISFTPDQYELVGKAIEDIKTALNKPEADQAEAIQDICIQYLFMRSANAAHGSSEQPAA